MPHRGSDVSSRLSAVLDQLTFATSFTGCLDLVESAWRRSRFRRFWIIGRQR
jgi:hypothetical protein